MDDEEVTVGSIKAELLSDGGFTHRILRCEIYLRIFHGEGFDRAEYEAMGNGTCRDVDPASVSFF